MSRTKTRTCVFQVVFLCTFWGTVLSDKINLACFGVPCSCVRAQPPNTGCSKLIWAFEGYGNHPAIHQQDLSPYCMDGLPCVVNSQHYKLNRKEKLRVVIKNIFSINTSILHLVKHAHVCYREQNESECFLLQVGATSQEAGRHMYVGSENVLKVS